MNQETLVLEILFCLTIKKKLDLAGICTSEYWEHLQYYHKVKEPQLKESLLTFYF